MAEKAKIDEKVVAANLKMLNKKVDMELDRVTQEDSLTEEEEKLLKLRENKDFMKDIVEAENHDDVRNAFLKQNVELSEEETREFIEGVQTTVGKVINSNGELSDNELEEIAGGSWSSFWKKAKKYVAAAVVTGVATAISAGIIAVTCGAGTGLAAVLEATAVGFGSGLASGAGGMGAKELWSKDIKPGLGL